MERVNIEMLQAISTFGSLEKAAKWLNTTTQKLRADLAFVPHRKNTNWKASVDSFIKQNNIELERVEE